MKSEILTLNESLETSKHKKLTPVNLHTFINVPNNLSSQPGNIDNTSKSISSASKTKLSCLFDNTII